MKCCYEGVKLVVGEKFEIGKIGKWGDYVDVRVDDVQHRGGPAVEAGDLLRFSSSVCQSHRCPWRQGGRFPLVLELDKS
jgi:hypothetical protein